MGLQYEYQISFKKLRKKLGSKIFMLSILVQICPYLLTAIIVNTLAIFYEERELILPLINYVNHSYLILNLQKAKCSFRFFIRSSLYYGSFCLISYQLSPNPSNHIILKLNEVSTWNVIYWYKFISYIRKMWCIRVD